MSVDFSDVEIYPSFLTFNVSSSANVATEVILPSRAKLVQVGSESGALFLSHTGTDNVALSVTNRGFIPTNNMLQFRLGTGTHRLSTLFIAGQSGSEKVVVIVEE